MKEVKQDTEATIEDKVAAVKIYESSAGLELTMEEVKQDTEAKILEDKVAVKKHEASADSEKTITDENKQDTEAKKEKYKSSAGSKLAMEEVKQDTEPKKEVRRSPRFMKSAEADRKSSQHPMASSSRQPSGGVVRKLDDPPKEKIPSKDDSVYEVPIKDGRKTSPPGNRGVEETKKRKLLGKPSSPRSGTEIAIEKASHTVADSITSAGEVLGPTFSNLESLLQKVFKDRKKLYRSIERDQKDMMRAINGLIEMVTPKGNGTALAGEENQPEVDPGTENVLEGDDVDIQFVLDTILGDEKEVEQGMEGDQTGNQVNDVVTSSHF